MTKAIIFDCFGVLATEAWLPFKAKHFGHDPDLYEQASQLSWQADVGEMNYQDLLRSVAKLAHITPEQAHNEIARNVPNEELFAYIDGLKKKYKIGLLSNVVSGYMENIFTSEQLERFDNISKSFESGYRKPQPEAYELTAKQLGVELSECVFVDDQERQIDGARQAGAKAILYKNFDQFKTDLEKLLA